MRARIARCCRARDHSNFSESIQHYERSVANITQPSECGQRDKAVVPDAYEARQLVIGARNAQPATFMSDAILNLQMSCLHGDSDAETVKREDSGLGDLRGRERLR